MTHLDERIRAALSAQAELISSADLGTRRDPVGTKRRRARIALPLLAAAAVAAVGIGVAVSVGPGHSSTGPAVGVSTDTAGPTPSPIPTTAPPTTALPSTAPPTSAAPTTGVTAPPAAQFEWGYQPVWPFGSLRLAQQWDPSGGSQPWHASATDTALLFTDNALGFTELDRVTSSRYDTDGSGAQGAHIGVGYLNPNGQAQTAAVLHLVRYGTSPTAPWEVVGSDDTTFSLERPAYGSTVTSPFVAGGHITGVDEQVNLALLDPNAQGHLTVLDSVPAGGQDSTWSSKPLPFVQRGVIVIVAWTGGHLQEVERFAIQAVHT